jgi:hypothetical protein
VIVAFQCAIRRERRQIGLKQNRDRCDREHSREHSQNHDFTMRNRICRLDGKSDDSFGRIGNGTPHSPTTH